MSSPSSNGSFEPRSRRSSGDKFYGTTLEYHTKWDESFFQEYEQVASKPLIAFLEPGCPFFSVVSMHVGYTYDALQLIELCKSLKCKFIQRAFRYDRLTMSREWGGRRSILRARYILTNVTRSQGLLWESRMGIRYLRSEFYVKLGEDEEYVCIEH
jgi:hypothetical protein